MENAKFRLNAATKASAAIVDLKTNGNPADPLMSRDAGQEAASPSRPPLKAKATVSNVIWKKMSAAVAPNARRVPISCVRSLTEIQVIATIPRPDTVRVLAAIHRKKKVRRLAVAIWVSSKLFWF